MSEEIEKYPKNKADIAQKRVTSIVASPVTKRNLTVNNKEGTARQGIKNQVIKNKDVNKP